GGDHRVVRRRDGGHVRQVRCVPVPPARAVRQRLGRLVPAEGGDRVAAPGCFGDDAAADVAGRAVDGDVHDEFSLGPNDGTTLTKGKQLLQSAMVTAWKPGGTSSTRTARVGWCSTASRPSGPG